MTIRNVPIQLLVETKERSADLYINGDITKSFQILGLNFGQETDVAYQDVVEALNDLPAEVSEICVHINSYGGEVAEGVAIYNALRSNEAHVTTVCEGFACSVASVIFMAGERRVMRESSLLMLHNASMGAHGDANAHRKAAEDLEVITELSKTAYLSHATEALTRETLTQIMDAETWVSPAQALEWGLCTEIDGFDEADEPTQSAAMSVQSALLYPATVESLPGDLQIRPAWVEQLFARMGELEQIITATPRQEPKAEPASEPEPESKPINQRVANIFQQLSN